MNVFIHGTQSIAARAYRDDTGVHGYCDVAEAKPRTGDATLFFDSAEDAEVMAERLRQLASQMRQLEAQRLQEAS